MASETEQLNAKVKPSVAKEFRTLVFMKHSSLHGKMNHELNIAINNHIKLLRKDLSVRDGINNGVKKSDNLKDER